MSTGLDLQFVKDNYAKLTDAELVRVATQDAAGLTPEAQQVVKDEISKRKLDPNIHKGIDAQNTSTYTIEEIDSYCRIIQELDCPKCESSFQKLNATMTGEVVSFIVMTSYSKKLHVACPTCLDKANNAALTKTAILGWWGIPWGIVRTIQYIIFNVKNKKTNSLDSPNKYLRNFVISNVGLLETYRNNKEKLRQIIS